MLHQTLAPGFCLLLLPPILDIVNQLVMSAITADTLLFGSAKFDRPEGSKILSVFRYFDQLFGLCALRNLYLALLPHARNVGLPSLAHAADKAIGPTQQEHMGTQGIAPG